MRCKICNEKTAPIFKEKILRKYEVQYFRCDACEFIQTEDPYWLDEAYISSINIQDTGYIQRNLHFAKKLTLLLPLVFEKHGRYLDYAGGYGVFVRIMRDIGFDFYWDDKYTENLFARGFEFANNSIEAITTFESFEHFLEPIVEIENMLKISNNIIFSTEMLPKAVPDTSWWYYGFEHGQHISLYRETTIHFIANKYGLQYSNLGGLHMLTDKKISNYFKYLLKLTKYGLHLIYAKQMKSRTWDDYLITKK